MSSEHGAQRRDAGGFGRAARQPVRRRPARRPPRQAAGTGGRRKPCARRLLASAAIALTAVLLFVAYLMVSRTYPENSDEANILLMAWDMLHGNVLLHGWYLSDVSFYPPSCRSTRCSRASSACTPTPRTSPRR